LSDSDVDFFNLDGAQTILIYIKAFLCSYEIQINMLEHCLME